MSDPLSADPEGAARRRVLADVTHALRTPLTLVLGPLDDLLAGDYGPVSEDATAALALARHHADRLRAVVDGMLDGTLPPPPVEPRGAPLAADVAAAREPVESDDITTVLVVDDEADIRAHVRRHLERAGYRVAEAADGRAGLAMARRLVPDLIVTDVMMPEMDGLDLCRALRADP